MRKSIIISVLVFCFIMLIGTSVMAGQTYVVQKGDSLWKISNSTGVSVDIIKKLNGLNSDNLKIGQKLILSNQSTTTSQSSGIVPVVQANTNDTKVYVVVSGDSLWSIANKFGMSVQKIKEINGLKNDLVHVGDKLKVSGTSVAPVVSRSSDGVDGDRIIAKAAEYLGIPYRYGGSSPNGFDCSGFTSYIFNQFQIKLPRTAASQYGSGITVARTDLLAGDLVFFACSGKSIDHVGIYCGDNKFIHSSSPRTGGVVYSSLGESYYADSYVGAKRIIR